VFVRPEPEPEPPGARPNGPDTSLVRSFQFEAVASEHCRRIRIAPFCVCVCWRVLDFGQRHVPFHFHLLSILLSTSMACSIPCCRHQRLMQAYDPVPFLTECMTDPSVRHPALSPRDHTHYSPMLIFTNERRCLSRSKKGRARVLFPIPIHCGRLICNRCVAY